jgi:hypothetical protein
VLPEKSERRAENIRLLSEMDAIRTELAQIGLDFEKYDELMAKLRGVQAQLVTG